MVSHARPQAPISTDDPASGPWGETASAVRIALGRRWWAVVLCGVLGAGALVGLRMAFPVKYTATTQLLFDPNGFRIFANELKAVNYDANASINFVESQMAVFLSERVLTRVLDAACQQGAEPLAGSGNLLAQYCPAEDLPAGRSQALKDLHRSLSLKRTERSFVVDVSAQAAEPDVAAELSRALVTAYMKENATNRADAAQKLAADMSVRMEDLRQALQASEAKAENYRREHNLVRIGDRLLIEQRLTSATTSLNESQAKLDRAAARARQIDAAARSPSALGALGAEADTKELLVLIERRNAIMVEMAPIAARAGARHPALIEVKSRLNEVNRSINEEMNAIRAVARADHSRAVGEHRNLAATVEDLTRRVSGARHAKIELRALEQQVEANRRLLESLENRSREAHEFGKIDAANLRIVSEARAPAARSKTVALSLWAAIGALGGLMLGFAVLLGSVLFQHWGAGKTAPRIGAAMPSPAHALQLRAQAFARYRVA